MYIVKKELYHHGIKGQKWGVRRYQNPNGTLTELGKQRRATFKQAESAIKSKLTTNVKSFEKQSIDILTVKTRGNLSDVEAIKCSILATKKFNEAAAAEPQITKDIISAVSGSNGKMYGLEYRLKQPSSIGAKIGSDSKDDGISFEEASAKIKDAVRYTAVFEDNDYTNGYNSVKQNLSNLGYSETKCKNYFNLYDQGESMHKAIQCTYKNKDGYEFELQFQTPSSQAAKELKIPIYEERRQAGISNQRASELESQMRDLAERVKNPPGVSSIGK